MSASTIILAVYARRGGVHGRELVGTAEAPSGLGDVLEILTSDGRLDRFAIGTMTVVQGNGALSSERVVLLDRGQRPERLPGWKPWENPSRSDGVWLTGGVPIFSLSRLA